MRLIIPEGYKSLITLKETEKILQMLKDHFEAGLSADFRLRRVTAPLFVLKGTGLNDDLHGYETETHIGRYIGKTGGVPH